MNILRTHPHSNWTLYENQTIHFCWQSDECCRGRKNLLTQWSVALLLRWWSGNYLSHFNHAREYNLKDHSKNDHRNFVRYRELGCIHHYRHILNRSGIWVMYTEYAMPMKFQCNHEGDAHQNCTSGRVIACGFWLGSFRQELFAVDSIAYSFVGHGACRYRYRTYERAFQIFLQCN